MCGPWRYTPGMPTRSPDDDTQFSSSPGYRGSFLLQIAIDRAVWARNQTLRSKAKGVSTMETRQFSRIDRSRQYSMIRALFTLALLLTLPTAARPDDGSFGIVVPPNTTPFGMTFGEWSARFWQWQFMLPVDQGPFNWPNETNPDCSVGQLGPVWFLVGFSPGPVTIACHVPAGKVLFFPIINNECSSLESDPFFGDTPEARRKCALRDTSGVVELRATIDGHSVGNLTKYAAQSPDFDIVVPPPPNVLGLSTGAFGQSGSFGYYLMLILSPGPPHPSYRGRNSELIDWRFCD